MNSEGVIAEKEFLQHFTRNAAHMMWLLGAGTSRTAGLPTAEDIIWDLKCRYYCLHENQNLQSHDINNKAIKNKLQAYFDSKGFPAKSSPEEYSFYFQKSFGDDYDAQRKYIGEVLSEKEVSLGIGHRALAALIYVGLARILFTTNFDDVIELAYSDVSGKNLTPFHLEGSYAALSALNDERFPIYAKIHGDFRYKSIKNLERDLVSNDEEMKKCFLASAVRSGLVVSGYSGRDQNVMAMLGEAIDQSNAFPHGLFWTVPRLSLASEVVIEFLSSARSKGIKASLVETGTFDEMLSKIWRNLEGKPSELDVKVRRTHFSEVKIPLPNPGNRYPILRTNALPVMRLPVQCGSITYGGSLTLRGLREKMREESTNAIVTYTDRILFWGNTGEASKLVPAEQQYKVESMNFEDTNGYLTGSTIAKSFFEEGLAKALCWNKPLFLRRRGNVYHAVVRSDNARDGIFTPLRSALSFKGTDGLIAGNVRGLVDITWAESLSIRLEQRGGLFWVMLEPDIWIKPLSRRQEATDFLKQRKRYRYNPQSYAVLDAWIQILLGRIGGADSAEVTCYPGHDFGGSFLIGTRTAYSRGCADAR